MRAVKRKHRRGGIILNHEPGETPARAIDMKLEWYKMFYSGALRLLHKNYLERSLDTATTYKQKLIGEINALPEELLPRFYRIVRALRSELTNKTAVTPRRGSLRGIWGNLEIDESHILAAKKSLFSYE
jgi:hypothetical protein